jgi:D-alanyl-D-alanine carboxypeptidase
MDILDVNNPNLDITQEWTNAQRWLMKHCTEYGFILRYPNGTTDLTGIIYEPWHYRYVGKETASAVSASGLVFEEYLQKES